MNRFSISQLVLSISSPSVSISLFTALYLPSRSSYSPVSTLSSISPLTSLSFSYSTQCAYSHGSASPLQLMYPSSNLHQKPQSSFQADYSILCFHVVNDLLFIYFSHLLISLLCCCCVI